VSGQLGDHPAQQCPALQGRPNWSTLIAFAPSSSSALSSILWLFSSLLLSQPELVLDVCVCYGSGIKPKLHYFDLLWIYCTTCCTSCCTHRRRFCGNIKGLVYTVDRGAVGIKYSLKTSTVKAGGSLLHDAGARTVFGSRAFCHAAPTIWNSLPADMTDNFNNMLLSCFKCSLTTYFFYKLSLATKSWTVSAPAIRFFKFTYGASPAAWLTD